VTTAKIRSHFHDHSRSFPESIDDVDSALDLLLDEFVIPGFASNRLTFVVEYPASQAALARVKKNRDGIEIALRFEAFLGTNELANGFYELADGAEQLRRFEQDNVRRQSRGQTPMPIDRALIEALNAEFPECSGVAMGLERVFMAVSGAAHIQQVQSFGAHNA
nr:EF-P lysine aminoacylase GenX [Gammaproteobacteria bacterium]